MPIYDDLANCFVCGGKTPPDESLVIYSRKGKDPDRPHYPFLEFHEPAPGTITQKIKILKLERIFRC